MPCIVRGMFRGGFGYRFMRISNSFKNGYLLRPLSHRTHYSATLMDTTLYTYQYGSFSAGRARSVNQPITYKTWKADNSGSRTGIPRTPVCRHPALKTPL